MDEDFQTWSAYHRDPDKRWVFNKLEVALRQNLHAGPAGTAPEVDGAYVVRPVYNVYGMGISARKVEYSIAQRDEYTNHSHVPPGHFWCQWLPGPQYTADYVREGGEWCLASVLSGYHQDEQESLTRFDYWLKHQPASLPDIPNDPSELSLRLPLDDIDKLNVEIRSGKVIEAHFRLGNDPFDDLPEGTTIYPLWDDDEVPPDSEFRANLFSDVERYSADGHLESVRVGYTIYRP